MKRVMTWLMANKRKTFFLTLIYFLLVILPHEWVGEKISALFSTHSRASYDLIIMSVFLFLLLFVGLAFWKRLSKHEERNKLFFWLSLTIIFILIANKFLLVVNIEFVHYLQYAIGAILLFAMIGNYFVVLFVAFLISLFDEGYQYFYLTPDNTDYFDFNDIIIDFLGAAFGLLLLKVLSLKEWGERKKKIKWGFYIPFFVFIFSFIAILQTSTLSIFPSEDKFKLVKKIEEGFWTIVPQGIVAPKLAITDYLSTYPDDEKASNLLKELKNSIRKRNASFSEKTGKKFGQKNRKGEAINYGLLMRELEDSGDPEFILLAREVRSVQKDIGLHLRASWENGIPEKYLNKNIPEITYHVVTPYEATLILIFLFGFYYLCFREKRIELQ